MGKGPRQSEEDMSGVTTPKFLALETRQMMLTFLDGNTGGGRLRWEDKDKLKSVSKEHQSTV